MRIRLLMATAAFATLAYGQHQYGREWRLHEEENIERSFTVPASAGPQKLLVDNISGYIHVTGGPGDRIEVKAHKRIGAASAEALQEAKRDVKLDLSQQGNFLRIYVDGPFRSGHGTNYRGDDYYGYRVAFDYDIQVPAAAEVVLKTINDGDIVVKNTTGDYEINGLNGGIEMQGIGGSGTVRTLNGPITVSFSRNPLRKSEFRTLNGKMDIYFQPGLNADLNFHTLNGGVYTDFEIASRPTAAAAGENRNRRFVYRSDRRRMSGRVGNGGPELTFNALNGAIRLHSKAI